MKEFLLRLFTWWHRQTFGTQVWTWRYGEFVGEDPTAHELYEGAAHFYERIATDFDGGKTDVDALAAFLGKNPSGN